MSTPIHEVIDEFERRLIKAKEASASLHGANPVDWYPWLLDQGPRIVQSWRVMDAILASDAEERKKKYDKT